MSEIIKFTPAHIQELTEKEYTTRLIYSKRANKAQKAHVQWVQSKERLNEALRQLGVM